MSVNAPVIDFPARREPVSVERFQRMQLCMSGLENLQAQFPEFARHFEPAIASLARESRRTRKSDRERVLALLEEWDQTGMFFEELIHETGLSRWGLRVVLKEIAPLITRSYVPRPAGEIGKPRLLIKLSHTQP